DRLLTCPMPIARTIEVVSTRTPQMRSAILALLLLLTAMVTPLTIAAPAEDVEVVAKHIDRVENPRELQNLWKDVINTPAEETIKKIVTEAYKTCVGCESFAVNFTDARLIHLRDSGEEHVGAISVTTWLYRLPSVRDKPVGK